MERGAARSRRENRPLGDGRAIGALGLASRDFGDNGNAKLRFGFSGGPPVKTGGFPRAYGARGGAGYARSEKILAQWAMARLWRVGVSFA